MPDVGDVIGTQQAVRSLQDREREESIRSSWIKAAAGAICETIPDDFIKCCQDSMPQEDGVSVACPEQKALRFTGQVTGILDCDWFSDDQTKVLLEDRNGMSMVSEGIDNRYHKVFSPVSITHNFVTDHISSDTDWPIQSLFDTSVSLSTPDFIFRLDGRTMAVVEVGTCQRMVDAPSYFLKKQLKYHPLLEDLMASHTRRVNFDRIFYGIIIVHPGGVLTNISLSREITNNLCGRFRLITDAIKISPVPDYWFYGLEKYDAPLKDHVEILSRISKRDLNELYGCENGKGPFKPDYEEVWDEPTDYKLVEDMLRDIRKEAIDRTCMEAEKRCDPQEDVRASLAELDEEERRYVEECSANAVVKDEKAVILFPAVIPRYYYQHKGEVDLSGGLPEGDHAHWKLFKRCYERARQYPERFNDDMCAEYDMAFKAEDDPEEKLVKKRRKLRRRVRPEIDDIRVALAMSGIQSKSLKDSPAIIEAGKKKKVRLSYSTRTDDIEDFVNKGCLSLMDPSPHPIIGSHDDVMGLLYDSALSHTATSLMHETIHQITPVEGGKNSNSYREINETFTTYFETNLAKLARFITCTAMEICPSYNQYCDKDNFLLKQILGTKIYLLLKPTSLSGHMFFMLAWQQSDAFDIPGLTSTNIFRKIRECGDWRFTELVSIKSKKLNNWCMFDARSIVSWATAREVYGQRVLATGDDLNMNHLESCSLMAILLLMSLENKSKTEQSITSLRYTLMEGFVTYPLRPNPQKMLRGNKYSTCIRSRLQLFIMKRTIQFMRYIITSQGFHYLAEESEEEVTIDEDSGDEEEGMDEDVGDEENNQEAAKKASKYKELKWINLINPFTTRSESDVFVLINCIYAGYARDKNDTSEENQMPELISKILTYEALYDKNNAHQYGTAREIKGDRFKKLGFSLNLLKAVIINAKDSLRKGYGKEWQKMLLTKINAELDTRTLASLATLKASSRYGPEFYTFNEKHKYKRTKAVQAIYPLIQEPSTHVSELYANALNIIETDGCMHICLFKKQQQGGLREIYVLTMASRIIQCVLESISKSISSLFGSDTLAAPECKGVVPHIHHQKSKRTMHGKPYATLCVSADAEKWNQGHMTTKFTIMLRAFLPDSLHGAIERGVSVFLRKRMMLPRGILKLFEKHRFQDWIYGESLFADPLMELTRRKYMGKRDAEAAIWAEIGMAHIETVSGMMQGILHYTSSLYHTIVQEFIKEQCESMGHDLFQKKQKELNLGDIYHSPFIVSVMQSSDDSGMLISVPCSSKTQLLTGSNLASACSMMKAAIGSQLGIYDSVKTTANTLNVFEFNSEFFIKTSHIRPLIRWCMSATRMSYKESFIDRQFEAASLCTTILEGGGSTSLSFVVALAQGMLNYQMLGSLNNPHFKEYVRRIKITPSPEAGYFIMPNVHGAGINGFRHNLMVHSLTSRYGSHLMHQLDQLKSAVNPDGKPNRPLEQTTVAILTRQVFLSMGNRVAYNALCKELRVHQNLEILESNPIYLYTEPSNSEQMRCEVALKLIGPGIAEAINNTITPERSMAATVYCQTRKVLTLRCFTSSQNMKKMSMMKILSDLERDWLYESQEDFPIHYWGILFPEMSDFCNMWTIMNSMASMSRKPIPLDFVRRNVSVQVVKGMWMFHPLDIKASIVLTWFGRKKKRDFRDYLHLIFRKLRDEFAWLQPTPHETLRLSPFQNHIQLRQFLESLSTNPRSVTISAVPVKTYSGEAIMQSVLPRVYSRGIELMPTYSLYRGSSSHEKELALLTSILFSPFTDRERTEAMERVIKQSTATLTSVTMKDTERVVAAFKRMLCMNNPGTLCVDVNEQILLQEDLMALNKGVFGYWEVVYNVDEGIIVNEVKANEREERVDLYSNNVTLRRRWIGRCGRTIFHCWVYKVESLDAYGEKVEANELVGIELSRYEHLDVVVMSLMRVLEEQKVRVTCCTHRAEFVLEQNTNFRVTENGEILLWKSKKKDFIVVKINKNLKQPLSDTEKLHFRLRLNELNVDIMAMQFSQDTHPSIVSWGNEVTYKRFKRSVERSGQLVGHYKCLTLYLKPKWVSMLDHVYTYNRLLRFPELSAIIRGQCMTMAPSSVNPFVLALCIRDDLNMNPGYEVIARAWDVACTTPLGQRIEIFGKVPPTALLGKIRDEFKYKYRNFIQHRVELPISQTKEIHSTDLEEDREELSGDFDCDLDFSALKEDIDDLVVKDDDYATLTVALADLAIDHTTVLKVKKKVYYVVGVTDWFSDLFDHYLADFDVGKTISRILDMNDAQEYYTVEERLIALMLSVDLTQKKRKDMGPSMKRVKIESDLMDLQRRSESYDPRKFNIAAVAREGTSLALCNVEDLPPDRTQDSSEEEGTHERPRIKKVLRKKKGVLGFMK